MAVRQKSNLPEISQPWGRSIEDDIDELKRVSSRNANDSGTTLAQLNSSVNLLSQQVLDLTATVNSQNATIADLNSRQGYGSTDTSNWFLNMSTGSGTYVSSASVSFTLSEARYVTLLATSDINMSITSASISAQLNIRVNGVPQYAAGMLVNTGVAFQSQNQAVVQRTVQLAAGAYVIDNYYAASGSGTGSVQYKGSNLSVTVLGKA